EPARRRHARRLRLEEEVGRRAQPQRGLAPLPRLEVEGHAALVGGVRLPVERVAVGRERADAAGARAVRWLDLDHVGAQVGEQTAGEQPALVREIYDAVAVEKPRRG